MSLYLMQIAASSQIDIVAEHLINLVEVPKSYCKNVTTLKITIFPVLPLVNLLPFMLTPFHVRSQF